MPRAPGTLPLAVYYAATLGFLAADLGFGFTARAAFFGDSVTLRLGWYALCCACFAVVVWKPLWAAVVALLESVASLSLLILTTALRVVIVTDDMIETGRGAVTAMEMINFLLSGGVGWFALQLNLRRLGA